MLKNKFFKFVSPLIALGGVASTPLFMSSCSSSYALSYEQIDDIMSDLRNAVISTNPDSDVGTDSHVMYVGNIGDYSRATWTTDDIANKTSKDSIADAQNALDQFTNAMKSYIVGKVTSGENLDGSKFEEKDNYENFLSDYFTSYVVDLYAQPVGTDEEQWAFSKLSDSSNSCYETFKCCDKNNKETPNSTLSISPQNVNNTGLDTSVYQILGGTSGTYESQGSAVWWNLFDNDGNGLYKWYDINGTASIKVLFFNKFSPNPYQEGYDPIGFYTTATFSCSGTI